MGILMGYSLIICASHVVQASTQDKACQTTLRRLALSMMESAGFALTLKLRRGQKTWPTSKMFMKGSNSTSVAIVQLISLQSPCAEHIDLRLVLIESNQQNHTPKTCALSVGLVSGLTTWRNILSVYMGTTQYHAPMKAVP